MNGIESHKIYLIAGILAIVGIIIAMIVIKFGGDDEVDPAIAQVNAQTMLPSIPSSQQEVQVTSKLGQIEDQQKEERNRERLAQANGDELNLNIFEVSEDPIGLSDESTEPKEVKQPTPKPKPRPRKPKAQKPIEQEPEQQQPEIDPDLAFATGFTKTKTSDIDILPSTIIIDAVIHDQKTVTDGSRITLRTTSDVTHDDKVIPKNSFLLGTVEYRTGRVFIKVPRIKYTDGTYVNRSFDLYDSNDGEVGIFSKELLESQAAQETGSDVVDEVANDVNSSIARGVIKSFGNKKIKLPEITLQRNQAVIIKSKL